MASHDPAPPFRQGEYAARGDYHRDLRPDWEYYPTYVAKLERVRAYLDRLPAGTRVLDVGCGTGVDLVRFVRGGAVATGVDVADAAIALARENLRHQSLTASLCVGDGEGLPFPDNTFDFVYAHGVVQYTPGDRALVEECRRVLRQGGTAFFQVYNRLSWLNALSRVMKVGLEHQDAPVIRMYSPGEFTGLLGGFSGVRVVYERFPVKSRLHGGWKGALYNHLFVGAFNAIPRPLVRRFGWHLLAFCRK